LAESRQHAALVQIIIGYIKREHAEVIALGIVDDLSSVIRRRETESHRRIRS